MMLKASTKTLILNPQMRSLISYCAAPHHLARSNSSTLPLQTVSYIEKCCLYSISPSRALSRVYCCSQAVSHTLSWVFTAPGPPRTPMGGVGALLAAEDGALSYR